MYERVSKEIQRLDAVAGKAGVVNSLRSILKKQKKAELKSVLDQQTKKAVGEYCKSTPIHDAHAYMSRNSHPAGQDAPTRGDC